MEFVYNINMETLVRYFNTINVIVYIDFIHLTASLTLLFIKSNVTTGICKLIVIVTPKSIQFLPHISYFLTVIEKV